MPITTKMDDFKDTTLHKEIESGDDLHEYKTNEGYIIDTGDEAYSDLKVAKDGKFPILIYARCIEFRKFITDDTGMNRTYNPYTPTLRRPSRPPELESVSETFDLAYHFGDCLFAGLW
jgi:hypothetical protein